MIVLSGYRGTAIDADAPSLIALAKQMELRFDALLRAPDAPPLDHIDAITAVLDGQSMTYVGRIYLNNFIYTTESTRLFSLGHD
jgi:hypothetical protein